MQIFTPKLHDPQEKSVQKAFGVKIRKNYLRKSTNFGSSLRPGDKICDKPGNRI